jgi:hypothetical protein
VFYIGWNWIHSGDASSDALEYTLNSRSIDSWHLCELCEKLFERKSFVKHHRKKVHHGEKDKELGRKRKNSRRIDRTSEKACR